jgi:hypothetical protein
LQYLARMLVFRSLAIGLLGACALLLSSGPVVQVRMLAEPYAPTSAVERAAREARHADALPQSVIDVAPGVTAAQLASLVRLAPGEHVTTIDDLPVEGDLGAGVLLAGLELRARRYIDLGVTGPAGTRRVVVLLH